jgi:hypothetical protein
MVASEDSSESLVWGSRAACNKAPAWHNPPMDLFLLKEDQYEPRDSQSALVRR